MRIRRNRLKKRKSFKPDIQTAELFLKKISHCNLNRVSSCCEIRKILKSLINFVHEAEARTASVRINNRELALALERERYNSRIILSEKIAVDSKYQELVNEHAITKSKLNLLQETYILDGVEFKSSIFPSLVKLSDEITKFMLKQNTTRQSLEIDSSILTSDKASSSFADSGSYQQAPTINSMIRNYGFRNQSLRVRRLSLTNFPSPIAEEHEEEVTEVPSTLVRKCKGGFRSMLNLSTSHYNVTRAPPPEPSSLSLHNEVYNNVSSESVTRSSGASVTAELKEAEKENIPTSETHLQYKYGSPQILLRRVATPKQDVSLTPVNNEQSTSIEMFRRTPEDQHSPVKVNDSSNDSYLSVIENSSIMQTERKDRTILTSTANSSTFLKLSRKKFFPDETCDSVLSVAMPMPRPSMSLGNEDEQPSTTTSDDILNMEELKNITARRNKRTINTISVRRSSRRSISVNGVIQNEENESLSGPSLRRSKRISTSISFKNCSNLEPSSDTSDSADIERPRRRVSNASYKEPPLNKKLRRN